MVQVLPAYNPWGEIGEALTSSVDTYKDRSDQLALQRSVSKLGKDASPQDILDAVTNTQTYSPKLKQEMLKNYIGVDTLMQERKKADQSALADNRKFALDSTRAEIDKNRAENELVKSRTREKRFDEKEKKKEEDAKFKEKKEEIDKAKATALLDANPHISEETKDAIRKAGGLDLKTTQDMYKYAFQAEDKTQRKEAEKNAKELMELQGEKVNLKFNGQAIQKVQELSNKLSGPGMVSAKAGFTTQAGKELESSALPIIKPILTLFNPSGPIAERKMRLLVEKYGVLASDPQWIRQAKIDTLKYYNDLAEAKVNEKIELFNKYDGKPPKEMLQNINLSMQMVENSMQGLVPVSLDGFQGYAPDPTQSAGEVLTFPNGKQYKSDGVKWSLAQ